MNVCKLPTPISVCSKPGPGSGRLKGKGVGREEYRAIVSRIRNYFRVALETALKKNISSRNSPRVSSPPPRIFHREIPSYLPPAFLKSSSPSCTIVNYRRQRDPAFHPRYFEIYVLGFRVAGYGKKGGFVRRISKYES